jgi:hypothetical protein
LDWERRRLGIFARRWRETGLASRSSLLGRSDRLRANLLDKIRIYLHAIPSVGIDALGRPGDERPWLFDVVPGSNLSARPEGGADFFISIGRNPLKSPDSWK